MKTPILLSATLGLGALVALTGCTTDTTDASKTSTPKPSTESSAISSDWPAPRATPTPINVPEEKADIACEEGEAVVADKEAEFTLAGDCEVVRILPSATGSILRTSGTITHLVVDADLTFTDAQAIKNVHADGNANDITYTGTKPKVDGSGKNNNITDVKA